MKNPHQKFYDKILKEMNEYRKEIREKYKLDKTETDVAIPKETKEGEGFGLFMWIAEEDGNIHNEILAIDSPITIIKLFVQRIRSVGNALVKMTNPKQYSNLFWKLGKLLSEAMPKVLTERVAKKMLEGIDCPVHGKDCPDKHKKEKEVEVC